MNNEKYKIDRLFYEAKSHYGYLGVTEEAEQVIIKIAKRETVYRSDFLAEARDFNLLKIASGLDVFPLYEKKRPRYNYLFVDLIAAFCAEGREVNVFRIPDTNLEDFVPLIKLQAETRIDTLTGVWVFGQFLQFYDFFETMNHKMYTGRYRYPIFNPNNFLINPKEHRLVCYNISGLINYKMGTQRDEASAVIEEISRFMLRWIKPGDDPLEQEFIKFVNRGGKVYEDFEDARKRFCALTDDLWGDQWTPFMYQKRYPSGIADLNWRILGEEK